ncbi:hypothetical protein [Candidatus Williamhamiltonella defendens]|uniref:hypothetical protein n=1 Tax=Candidatus Williamhamiltonella defendens TaxID=138072 RepID=UPI001874ECEF|nr:hypothetical protein [Candidatus Hamiltonella defensa]
MKSISRHTNAEGQFRLNFVGRIGVFSATPVSLNEQSHQYVPTVSAGDDRSP